MNGCVIKGTPIAVDFWKPTKAPQARLFFLTHLHADHTQGLTRSWRLPIYTSPTNAVLLDHKFKLPKSIIRELEVGETYLIPLDDEGNFPISVTVIDANHVPGAVMYLFQGYFGNILYCGDMRWYPELLEHEVLRNVVELRELDIVYLDNTFSAPYCVFPSREECKQQLFHIIDSFPDHIIKIGIRDLGREDLLEAIARRFQERILVTQSKFNLLQLLQYSDVFTTDPEEARIHAVPLQQLQVASHARWNQEHPTVSVVLTALYVGWPNGPYSSQSNSGIFTVPYSDHSSYAELMELVAQLAPRSVIPIVQQWSKAGWWSDPNAPDQMIKTDMSVYDHFLTLPPPEPIVVPEAVANLMRAGAPMLFCNQPRRCGLRRGLTPRPRRTRGVIYTTPESHVSSPALSPAPTSSVTLDFSVPDTPASHLQLYSPNRSLTPKKTGNLDNIVNARRQLYAPNLSVEDISLPNRQHLMPHTTGDSSPSSIKANFTHTSDIHIMETDYNEQDPSVETFRDHTLKDKCSQFRPDVSNISLLAPLNANMAHSLSRVNEQTQFNAQNISDDTLSSLSLQNKRSHLIAHTTALISSQCAILQNNNDNDMNKDEISGLLKNTKAVCEALALIDSML
ncbi:5' exonuclease Apollo-like isoform X1 [Panulirus ornatus]|uniref:5' exonuclease Apollo-like isoform X1 n=2 Tax=Panulirus ornatus TaxID=150431 RepID=UPI003A8C7498